MLGAEAARTVRVLGPGDLVVGIGSRQHIDVAVTVQVGGEDGPRTVRSGRNHLLGSEVPAAEFLPIEEPVAVGIRHPRIGAHRLLGQVAEAIGVRVQILLTRCQRIKTVVEFEVVEQAIAIVVEVGIVASAIAVGVGALEGVQGEGVRDIGHFVAVDIVGGGEEDVEVGSRCTIQIFV